MKVDSDHFQMGLCPAALIFITVTLWLRHAWQTWDCEGKHDLYTPMSISKGELMQISLSGLCQDSLEQKALLISPLNENNIYFNTQ